jgi:hypothetical protein
VFLREVFYYRISWSCGCCSAVVLRREDSSACDVLDTLNVMKAFSVSHTGFAEVLAASSVVE